MSGFFAAGRWWDVSAVDLAQMNMSAARLTDAGIPAAQSEVQTIWAIAQSRTQDFATLVARRAAREPLSHLLGYRDFYRHRFEVSPDVLDPRPDTETLVDVALAGAFNTVADLGTGSGCIVLSLLAERPTAKGTGTDLSQAALSIAARNADRLGVSDRVSLIQSDWYDSLNGAFDLIVSNPPYIARDEMHDLQPEVRDHEPRMALTDEGDGLSCYRTIVAGAPRHLTNGGRLAMEIGPTQGSAVTDMMQAAGFAHIAVTQDIDGRDRVVSGKILQ